MEVKPSHELARTLYIPRLMIYACKMVEKQWDASLSELPDGNAKWADYDQVYNKLVLQMK